MCPGLLAAEAGLWDGAVLELQQGIKGWVILLRNKNYLHSFHNKEPCEDNLGTAVEVGLPPLSAGICASQAEGIASVIF